MSVAFEASFILLCTASPLTSYFNLTLHIFQDIRNSINRLMDFPTNFLLKYLYIN